MNREIKFRVWDNFNEQFLKSDTANLNFIYNGQWLPVSKFIGSESYTIQQITGLKDKNDKEIYEGDILQYNQNSSYDNMNFIVKWSNESLGWVFQSGSGEVLCNNNTPNGKRFNLIEVKSNIFEI